MFNKMVTPTGGSGGGLTIVSSKTTGVENSTVTLDAGKYIIVVTGYSGGLTSNTNVKATVDNGTLTQDFNKYFDYGANSYDMSTKVYELDTSSNTTVTFGTVTRAEIIYKLS